MKITVAIITKSEKIDKLILDAVNFSDEIIIVVDSPDKKSKKIGKISYYYRPLDNNFSSQRNFALGKARNNWVLFVDDDEYVGTELAKEIRELDPEKEYDGFLIRRIDVCFHQRLLHGETGNIKLLRLGRKTAGEFVRSVHETWKINGKIGTLHSPLFHKKDDLVGGFIERMSHYSMIDAGALLKENKPFSYWRLLLNPKGKFIRNYFFKMGFLDGTVGLFSAYLMSIQSLTVRIFQWTKRN